MSNEEKSGRKRGGVSRRDFLRYASASAGITAAALALGKSASSSIPMSTYPTTERFLHGHPHNVSAISQVPGGMNPMEFLESYYSGQFNANGEREFELTAAPQSIEVARGVQFPAWTFYGPSPWGPTAPGPTLRCSEGDRVLIKFHNGDIHPHTIHLHGIHPALADGVFEIWNPGDNYTYAFDAEPFGLFLYHCHVMSVKKHISKGLYGAFIVDPVATSALGLRPAASRELVMVMNGFDVNFDDENDFYTVNGIANYYLDNPIQIGVEDLVRIYLVNITEFDPVNSFHLHGHMFRLYRTGTRFDPAAPPFSRTGDPQTRDQRIRDWLYADKTAEITDTVFLGQGERAIIEFIPKNTGRFLFHAHQSEFIELGWTGLFEVV